MSNDMKLTTEERDILSKYDRDEFESVMTSEMRDAYVNAARQTLPKDERVNSRKTNRSSHDDH